MDKLDDKKLERFIRGFFGYGDYSAEYWYIGMEEGSTDEFEEIRNRLECWRNHELEDLAKFHECIGRGHHFTGKRELQPTWARLIRFHLALTSERQFKTSREAREAVRDFQCGHLGTKGGNTCLLELLPLPSGNSVDWAYDQWSDSDHLKSRKTFKDHMLPYRIEHIKKRILEHEPKLVVFYSHVCERYWHSIAEINLTRNRVQRKGATYFMIIIRRPGASKIRILKIVAANAGDW